MTQGVRGQDRIPYGRPGNNRKPGAGRSAKYPWLTWASEHVTHTVALADFQVSEPVFKQAVANKVWQINRVLQSRSAPAILKHRVLRSDRAVGEVLLTFYWFEDEVAFEQGEDSPIPAAALELFGSVRNASHEDLVRHRQQTGQFQAPEPTSAPTVASGLRVPTTPGKMAEMSANKPEGWEDATGVYNNYPPRLPQSKPGQYLIHRTDNNMVIDMFGDWNTPVDLDQQ